ncbi:hypothetical protein NDU88_005633 [Pleurodeles waltl]|uniref:Uncharacterized protein n=1 Tax=Pleurodeles waltl TaxID=8319 RepID=A0AAV7WV86_PLEWA|nr:hypothetical protein NDU88_005633 [Pleurodeles waltl]
MSALERDNDSGPAVEVVREEETVGTGTNVCPPDSIPGPSAKHRKKAQKIKSSEPKVVMRVRRLINQSKVSIASADPWNSLSTQQGDLLDIELRSIYDRLAAIKASIGKLFKPGKASLPPEAAGICKVWVQFTGYSWGPRYVSLSTKCKYED